MYLIEIKYDKYKATALLGTMYMTKKLKLMLIIVLLLFAICSHRGINFYISNLSLNQFIPIFGNMYLTNINLMLVYNTLLCRTDIIRECV